MKLNNVTKVAIFADLHLGVHLDSILWHKITKDWVKWFRNELDKKNIDTIIFLGDVFHSRSDIAVNTLQVASDVFQTLKDFNIIMIVGNHDSMQKYSTDINSTSIFKEWSNIRVINNIETIYIGSKKCTFVNWESNISNLSQCDYIFGHLELTSFKMNNYKICERGVSPQDLLKISPNIYSGHFHHRNERNYSNGNIIYVGNPFEMDFGDVNNKKGVYIVDLENNKYEFIQNDISPIHTKIKYSEYDDSVKIQGKIVKLIIDIKVSIEEVDKLVIKISKQEPLQLSIEYMYNERVELTNISNCDLSGISRQKAIEDFINLLEIDNKDSLNKLCQDIFSNIK